MANKNPGTQSDNTMNREVRPQFDQRDGRQFSCNEAPYGENYYTVKYDANGNEITQSGDYTPDGDFYQSGSSDPAVGDAGQFRGVFASTDAGSLGPLAKQIAEGEIRPHANDFADKRSTTFVDVGRANRGSDDGYDPNQPSPERNRTHMDFSRGGKR